MHPLPTEIHYQGITILRLLNYSCQRTYSATTVYTTGVSTFELDDLYRCVGKPVGKPAVYM